MAITLPIYDMKLRQDNQQPAIELKVVSEQISVQELIELWVTQEVEDYNQRQNPFFNGLVQPTEAEKTVNGYLLKKGKEINCQAQIDNALEAFQKNGFFIIVDGKQVDSLEDQIGVRDDTKVQFLKLVPLIGG